MAVPATPNHQVVTKCLANLIENLTSANGWYFDGIMVDYDRDPRNVRSDRAREWAQKRNLIVIKHGGAERLRADDPSSVKIHARSIGPVKRRKFRMELWSLQSISDAESRAGETLSGLADKMRYSIEWGLHFDQKLTLAATRLEIDPPESCINLQLEDVISDGVIRFPDVYQVLVLSYLADEHKPTIP